MSKRRKRNSSTTTVSKIFNFISPFAFLSDQMAPGYDYTQDKAVFAYGPLSVDHAVPVDVNTPAIFFPIGETPEGTRTMTNISLQCSFSFCQVNSSTGKYELFYPNCSIYLITTLMKNGQRLSSLQKDLFDTSEQTTMDSRMVIDPETAPINSIILDRTGSCGYPVSNILDVQPLRTCNGSVQSPQYINQVYIPGPIKLEQDDKIVVLVIIPTPYTFNHLVRV